jgi:16S rRNA (cytosine967-C5)-methyltransferase
VSPARAAAVAALRRLRADDGRLEGGPEGLPELAGLDPRDRALAYELVHGTLRRRGSCDAVLGALTRGVHRVEPDVLDVLRLASYQVLFLDRVPPYAAVDDAVAMVARPVTPAPRSAPVGRARRPRERRRQGFVNAVLRRVAGEGRELFDRLASGDDDRAWAVRWSAPDWIVALLRRDLGDGAAEDLLRAAVRPPERCVRVNALRASLTTATEVLVADGFVVAAAAGMSDALLVDGPPLEGSRAFAEGLVTPQSRGSQLVAPLAAPGAPAAVLDLCAAPGTKTSHLAALQPAARLVAVDVAPSRLAQMGKNLERLGVRGVEVLQGDALHLAEGFVAAFDAVLLDAPCTGLGTLGTRPDLRWRLRARDVPRLAELQGRLLDAAARCVAPGGTLTYAVCTLTRAETLGVVGSFRGGAEWSFDDLGAAHGELAHPESGAFMRTLPPGDGATGFFIARLRRASHAKAVAAGGPGDRIRATPAVRRRRPPEVNSG